MKSLLTPEKYISLLKTTYRVRINECYLSTIGMLNYIEGCGIKVSDEEKQKAKDDFKKYKKELVDSYKDEYRKFLEI